jgi:RNA polymerase sigma-70 factor (ECF subfamily)
MLKYQPRIASLISRFIQDADEVKDVMQDSFLKAYRAIDEFRGDSEFYTWIYRIASNTAKNYLAARDRRPPDSDLDAATYEFIDCPNVVEIASPENLLLRDEIEQMIYQVINTLSEEYQQVIVMREIEGQSYEDIARILKCPIGTIRSRIFRARQIIDQSVDPLLMD